MSNTDCENEIPVAEDLSDIDRFWINWWTEGPKLNIALMRDLLGRLITLSAGLAGGSAAFLDEKTMIPVCRGVAVVCFFLALISACAGIIPRVEHVPPYLEDIQASKERALARMRLAFVLAATGIGLGFGAIIFGLLLRMISPLPPC